MAKELWSSSTPGARPSRATPSSSGGPWEEEFGKTFEYEETEDQLRSIREIRADMEREVPMDRLLCGDVGYGKTEVAMRAAFKAVMDGKQVAVLCPTTVLASQHLKTFRDRMVLFPVRVEALTRLQTPREQKALVEDARKGLVDILIGTHRLLSKDVGFKDLGLLVVDEEQRFGVGHKEKIKQLKATIDVLTLTATPIPRTLNMSLTGLRDISAHRDAAAGPAGRAHGRDLLQRQAHRRRRPPGARPGRPGLLHPQPHRGHRQGRRARRPRSCPRPGSWPSTAGCPVRPWRSG